MKKTLIFILILMSFSTLDAAFTKTNTSHSASDKIYSFNFGRVKLESCLLKRKKGDYRKFQGTLKNRGSSELEWIKLEFYFRDPDYNNGRYSLVSAEIIKNIPKRSYKQFKLKIPVGIIDGRDFKVKMTGYKEVEE